MRESLGGGFLLNIVIIFAGIVIMLFIGILSYSKAYGVKDRIIEIIEKYGTYDDRVVSELNSDLHSAGYSLADTAKCDGSIRKNLVSGENAKYNDKLSENKNTGNYNYCIYEMCDSRGDDGTCEDFNGNYYVVVTFIHFEFPVIGDILTFPVYGETKVLNKSYDY